MFSHTALLFLGAYSVCVHLFLPTHPTFLPPAFPSCVFSFFSPSVHPYVLSIWRAIYLEYLEGYIFSGFLVHSYLLLRSCFLAPSFFSEDYDLHDTPLPVATKFAQLIFRDQNYVSSTTHFIYVGLMCIYTIVYALGIPSIWSGGQR